MSMLHSMRSSRKKSGPFVGIWPRLYNQKREKAQSIKPSKIKLMRASSRSHIFCYSTSRSLLWNKLKFPFKSAGTQFQERSIGRNQTMVLKNKKKGKLLLRNRSNVGEPEGEDKISNLPDALIHHILSFLPTKSGLSTCILSKRWKYIVYSIPNLDFRNWRVSKNRNYVNETKRFMNFLDKVLFRYEKFNVQKFYLDWDRFFDVSRVNRWISAIMKGKVEEFGLSIKVFKASSIIPIVVSVCDSLTQLELDLFLKTGGKFTLPNNVSFPKLKVLRLTRLSFLEETSSSSFISKCPILEELSLSDSLMSKELSIANPAPKHLSITFCELTQCTVKISAPNLLTIFYRGTLPADFVLDSILSLVEADVDCLIGKEYGNTNKVFFKLFEKLSSAKILKICPSSFPGLKDANILLTDLLTFNNLIHLEVTSGYSSTYFGSFSDSPDHTSNLGAFFRFLQLSRNVESIILSQNREDGDYWSLDPKCYLDREDYRSLDPKYTLPHLKSVKFIHFHGKSQELHAVKLFLNYAGFLETVTIVASPRLSKDLMKLLNVMKLLLMFPKPENCVFKFLTSNEEA